MGLDACPMPQLVKELFEKRGIPMMVPTEELRETRGVKSPDEVACMKISAAIAESALYEMQKAMHPAVRENDLAAIGIRKQYFHGTDEVVPPAVVSGWRTNPMHCDFTDRLIMAGDLTAIHMDAVSFNGYKTSLGRTFVIGKATPEQHAAYATALRLMRDAIGAIRPGATTADIQAAWPNTPEFWGYTDPEDVRRCAWGHGIGLILEDGPWFSAVDGHAPVRLEPGMTLALETWYGPHGADFGASIKETVLVTEEGCEVLTHYPVDGIIEIPLGQ